MKLHRSWSVVVTLAGAAGLMSTAHAASLDITTAKVAAGLLQITGTSPLPNQNVQLDNQFTVMSDATKNFTFSLDDYLPTD